MEVRVQSNPLQPFQTVRVTLGNVAAPKPVPKPAAKPIDTLKETFNQLREAEELRLKGELDAAQSICERLLSEYPNYWGALHTVGLVFIDKEEYERALYPLIRALMLDPHSSTTLTALGATYQALGALEMAARTFEQARAINPQDTTILSKLGEIYLEEREQELARDVLQQALALDGELEEAAIGLARVYSSTGQNAEAVEIFQGLIQRGSKSLEVLSSLARLPSKLVKLDVLSHLDGLVPEDPKVDRTLFESTVAFVRVAALDQAGRHTEAWEHALPANQAMFSANRDEHRRYTERENALLAWLRANKVEACREGDDGRCATSLFILGPSRSGKTTTMERIVGTLPGVKRGYENPAVDIAVRRAFQTAGLLNNGYFELLPEQLYSVCRDIYLDELARRAGSAKVFTNTHPGHITDAAFMMAAFPKVRFVFVKRNVDDIILRMFQRRYHAGNFYSYDLKSARDHVLWYHEMMNLLEEKFPDVVRVIQYEDMVADPAAALRTATELCGLPTPAGPVPAVGSDRGCAEPYREWMTAAMARRADS
jgi:tetratricopeptide (TPR) repeat protein